MAKLRTDNSKYSKKKFLLVFCCAMLLLALIRHTFSIEVPMPEIEKKPVMANVHAEEEPMVDEENSGDENAEQNEENEIYGGEDITDEEVNVGGQEETEVPEEEEFLPQEETHSDTCTTPQHHKPAVKKSFNYTEEEERALMAALGIKGTDSLKLFFPEKYKPMTRVHSYSECFPDINPVQLKAAMANGVKPAKSREEAAIHVENHELVNITNSPYYVVDKLTHSTPYLVPKCQELLNTICVNFIDSLMSKGIPPHLPIITSVLRTSNDVSKLQKGGNPNATTNSCHRYGTTVDITYNRFYPITGSHKTSRKNVARYNERMKKILAQVLLDLRMEGRCYVKYEYKQACFHITVR